MIVPVGFLALVIAYFENCSKVTLGEGLTGTINSKDFTGAQFVNAVGAITLTAGTGKVAVDKADMIGEKGGAAVTGSQIATGRSADAEYLALTSVTLKASVTGNAWYFDNGAGRDVVLGTGTSSDVVLGVVKGTTISVEGITNNATGKIVKVTGATPTVQVESTATALPYSTFEVGDTAIVAEEVAKT